MRDYYGGIFSVFLSFVRGGRKPVPHPPQPPTSQIPTPGHSPARGDLARPCGDSREKRPRRRSRARPLRRGPPSAAPQLSRENGCAQLSRETGAELSRAAGSRRENLARFSTLNSPSGPREISRDLTPLPPTPVFQHEPGFFSFPFFFFSLIFIILTNTKVGAGPHPPAPPTKPEEKEVRRGGGEGGAWLTHRPAPSGGNKKTAGGGRGLDGTAVRWAWFWL